MYDKDLLIKLRDLLQAICHAEVCKTKARCPRICKCERSFKLNAETAVCWTIADIISPLLYGEHKEQSILDTITDKVHGILRFSNYHMAPRWKNFFRLTSLCLTTMIQPGVYYITPEEIMAQMKEFLPTFQRELKNNMEVSL